MGLPTGGEILHVAVSAENDGDNTVVAAVTGKKLRVLGYALTVDVAGLVTLQDSAGSPVVHGKLRLAAGTPAVYDGGFDCPAFETAAGVALEINNPAGTNTYGHITYLEVS